MIETTWLVVARGSLLYLRCYRELILKYDMARHGLRMIHRPDVFQANAYGVSVNDGALY
jgi:hypothetical protein